MTRKLEVLIGLVIVLALVGFIGVNVFSASFDKDAGIDKMADAIFDNDLDYLEKYIRLEGDKSPLNKEELAGVVEILRDNRVHIDLERYYENPDSSIYLRQDGREKLFFNKYLLVVRPYTLNLESNFSESIVYLNGREIGKINMGTFDFQYPGLLPGYHEIKLVNKGDYSELEGHEVIECFSRNDREINAYVHVDGDFVEIYSNREEAQLYIDGKETEIFLDSTYTIGPIAMDGSVLIKAKAEIEGETYESEEIPLSHGWTSYELYIDYEEPEEIDIYEVHEKIHFLIEDYLYGMVDAINYNDYSYVSPYIEYNSPLMKSQQNLIQHLNSKGTTEELIQYRFQDPVEVGEGEYEATITEEHYIYYASGEVSEVSNTWVYTVIKDGEEYYLRDLR